MSLLLFLGGSIDGTRREVDAHVDRVQVPRVADLSIFTKPFAARTEEEKAGAQIDHYRRVYLPVHRGERTSLMVHSSISPEDSLRLLVEGYHPKP